MHTSSITIRIPGEARSVNFWVWLRGADVNPDDDDDIRMLVPWFREHVASFSRRREHLGGEIFIHQEMTAAVLAATDIADLPILQQHIKDGKLYVGDAEGNRLLEAEDAGKLFVEALRWCDPDYHDLLPEFGDLIRQRLDSR
jgi:hypothetical protein